MSAILFRLRSRLNDLRYIFQHELKMCLRDQGVLIFFILVPLAYPLLYAFIYNREVVREVPVAVVDDNRSTASRRYVRLVDASPDVRVTAWCADMAEARRMVQRRQAYGIIYVPRDFSRRLAQGEQTYVTAFCDMSGLLYYKAILLANTEVSLKMNAAIKTARIPALTAEQDRITQQPLQYDEVALFNPQTGFAAFLIPAVLILVIQQTLLLGVGMACGTAREHNAQHELIPVNRHYAGAFRTAGGKALCYLFIYIPVTLYVLGIVPHLFRLSQLAAPLTLALFALPYVLACIGLAMAVSTFIRHRETGMLLIVFTSVPLLFLSGISWPGSAIPPFWKAVSLFFPSTFGINGFVRLNTMGGTLADVVSEWAGLWVQAFVYFGLTVLRYRGLIRSARHRRLAIRSQLLQRRAYKGGV